MVIGTEGVGEGVRAAVAALRDSVATTAVIIWLEIVVQTKGELSKGTAARRLSRRCFFKG